jgi:hypothetical protein
MTPDVKGLLFGAEQVAPHGAGGARQGQAQADSPFSLLLASAAPGRAAGEEQPVPGAPGQPAKARTLDVRAAMAASAGAAPRSQAPRRGAATAVQPTSVEATPSTVHPASSPTAQAGLAPLGGPTASLPALEGTIGTQRAGLEGEGSVHHQVSEHELEVVESRLQPAPAPFPAQAGSGVIPPQTGQAAAAVADRVAFQAATQAAKQVAARATQPGQDVIASAAADLARPARRDVGGASQFASGASPLAGARALRQAAARQVPGDGSDGSAAGFPHDQAAALEAATSSGTPDSATASKTVAAQATPAAPPTRTGGAPGQQALTPAPPAVTPPPVPVTGANPAAATSPLEEPPAAVQVPSTPASAPTATPGPAGSTAPASPEPGLERSWRAASRASAPPVAPDASAAQSQPEPAAGQQGSQQASRREDRRSGREESPAARTATPQRPQAAKVEVSAPRTAAPPAPTAVVTERAVAREFGTSARLTQASRAGQPIRDGSDAKASRSGQAVEGALQPQPALQPAPPAPEGPARPSAPVLRGAPVQPSELAQALQGGNITAGGAHLRLESETLGDLALHLRVRDGVAHVRVEGEQASQLAGRGQELQRALAAEGLKLGRLELEPPKAPASPQGDLARGAADQGQQAGARDRPERESTTSGSQPGATTPPRRPSGRATVHHVEA